MGADLPIRGAVGAERRLEPLAQRARFARQGDLLQPFFEHFAQALRLERFGQIIVGAELDRLHRGIDGCLAGDEDDGDFLRPLAEGGDEFQTVHARHHQVGDDGVGQLILAEFERGFAVGGFAGVYSPSFPAKRLRPSRVASSSSTTSTVGRGRAI